MIKKSKLLKKLIIQKNISTLIQKSMIKIIRQKYLE